MNTAEKRRYGVAAVVVWTPERDAAIRERYFTDHADKIAADLGLTRGAVFHRARRLGLRKNRPWTDRDNAQLRELWGEMGLAQLSTHLKRTKAAIYHQGQILGLTSHVPQGMEYLTAAADRTGYDTSQLRMILRWAGVQLHPALGRPKKRKTRNRFHLVVPYDVNEAIAAWLKTEPLEAAARRHGVSGEYLARRLQFIPGVQKRPGKKKRWRVPTDAVEAAMKIGPLKVGRRRGVGGRFSGGPATVTVAEQDYTIERKAAA